MEIFGQINHILANYFIYFYTLNHYCKFNSIFFEKQSGTIAFHVCYTNVIYVLLNFIHFDGFIYVI